MSSEDRRMIEECKALLAKATAGEWRVAQGRGSDVCADALIVSPAALAGGDAVCVLSPLDRVNVADLANAASIAALHNHAPRLLQLAESALPALSGKTRKCPACDSTNLYVYPQIYNTTSVVDGRLRMHDLTVRFVLGCHECSETVGIVETLAEAQALLAPALSEEKARGLANEIADEYRRRIDHNAKKGATEFETAYWLERAITSALLQSPESGNLDLTREKPTHPDPNAWGGKGGL